MIKGGLNWSTQINSQKGVRVENFKVNNYFYDLCYFCSIDISTDKNELENKDDTRIANKVKKIELDI
jgi:hypothetical protein